MSKVQELFRIAILSPEFVYFLATTTIARDWLLEIAKILRPSGLGDFSILAGASLAILAGSYKLGYDLLNPNEKKKVLLEWEDYWKLKLRIAFSLAIGIAAFLGMLIGILIFYANKEILFLGYAYAFLGLSPITLSTIGWARIELQDILQQ